MTYRPGVLSTGDWDVEASDRANDGRQCPGIQLGGCSGKGGGVGGVNKGRRQRRSADRRFGGAI